MLPTKPKPGELSKSSTGSEPKKELDPVDDFIARVIWLRGEQLTGDLDFSEISEVEYQALVFLNSRYDQYDRRNAISHRYYSERILDWQMALAGARVK